MPGGVLEAVSRRSRRMVVRLLDIAVRSVASMHAHLRDKSDLRSFVTGHTPC
jgi:hypothetical protein